MLLVNGKKVSAKDFCIEHKIDLQKIMDNPVFELHKKYQKVDKANGGHIKVPAKKSWPAKTFIRTNDGETLEIRYAENIGYKTIKNERVEVYTPRYISTDTAKFSANKDQDKAVWLYVNSNQASSPFGGNPKNYEYQHLDPTEIAKTRMAQVNAVSDVMSSIKKLDDLELIVMAKGLKATFKQFNPFIDGPNTHIDLVRVEVMTFGQAHATQVLEFMENKVGALKGQIVNLVDKGVIKETTNMNMRQWQWAKGDRAGNAIGDQIIDPHADSLDYLLNYILGNIGQYYADINTVHANHTVEQSAIEFLKNQESGKVVIEQSTKGLPTNFQEAKEWLEENGFKKHPKLAKQLNDGIISGDIHTGNVLEMVTLFVEQMQED